MAGNKNNSSLTVYSKVLQLRKVLISAPRRAHHALTPSKCDE